MAAPIPVELRRRIVHAVRSGMTWQEASDLFAVGMATVNRLMRIDRERESLEPRGHGGGQRHRIPDDQLDRLRKLVDQRPDATIAELKESYRSETGVAVGDSTLWRALIRLGLSRKKRRSSTPSARSSASTKPGSRSGN